ncbi:pantoate--beta-alanine ligase [Maridesulfovibrio bastinii]|uniref:pantoate--beta-alanine ligase n=1 Tax=Maridesulfovibrio bastinii TaxID=47157 RepID=UPI00041DAF4A|nr:pantoate--beta-alanine ligase [Maridesulfovibrio bastinii]
MEIIKNPEELQKRALEIRAQGKTIALVPTMGYFHNGHLSLMQTARPKADVLICSLFVNPTQFGPNEDLESYPHDLDRDAALAEKNGVDILFAPDPAKMYHENHSTWVSVPDLTQNLCGASRPIHFRGVATVVTKLFMLAQPNVAVFGQKDWQQLAMIKRMVRDLDIPIDIVSQPIVREESGLALSSRNVYLKEDELAQAPNIRKGLLRLKQQVDDGIVDCEVLKENLKEFYNSEIPLGTIDYIEIVHPDDITPLKKINGPALCAVAVKLISARLIDNILV